MYVYIYLHHNFFLSVKSLNGEFMSSIFHLLPLIYPIFTCLDPDSYSAYGSTKGPEYCEYVVFTEYESNLDPYPQHCVEG